MSTRGGEAALFAAGAAYLTALSWSMTNLSYDIWGALLLIPIYGALGFLGVRVMFRGADAGLAVALSWGLLFKLGGAFARYWVGFEAYEGGIDAGEYHELARTRAADVWRGEVSVFDVVPTGSGTEFVENLTTFVYTLTGGSQLAGFVTFSFLAFWGIAFMVKAAAIAVPGLAARRYAWLCVLFPSIVYWPSSIGKEAVMMLGLGIGSYGIAIMLARHRWIGAAIVVGAGLGFAALIRPHMAGIWLAAALPALVLTMFLGSRSLTAGGQKKRVGRLGLIMVLAIATIGLGAIASATLTFFEPISDDPTSTSLTEIFEETQRRTAQAGSSFVPPAITNPTDWPYAVVRTLTRPLPMEASGIAQLVSAAEIVALFGLYALSWRRIRTLPRMLVTTPYVLFVVIAIFLSGLAFSSFANLGVLTRQKSLIIPFMLLVACLPRRERDEPGSHPALAEPRSTSGGDDPRRAAVPTASVGAGPADPELDDRDLDDFWS